MTDSPEPTAEAAQQMLAELGRALEVAIVIHDVEGEGPVRVRASIMHGSDAVDVDVDGPTEAAALVELARRAVAIRGADPYWIRRYGFGVG